MTMPIFPLSVFLLPGGVTRLRIFEQKYLSMVKEAEKTQGFVISYYQKSTPFHISAWGSWVEIVNFDLGEDNILVIDVKCKCLVKIGQAEYSDNKLLWANVEPMCHWADSPVLKKDLRLTSSLKNFFSLHEHLAEVYQGEFKDDLSWVCARWLELIPLSLPSKYLFTQSKSFDDALDFLTSVITENK